MGWANSRGGPDVEVIRYISNSLVRFVVVKQQQQHTFRTPLEVDSCFFGHLGEASPSVSSAERCVNKTIITAECDCSHYSMGKLMTLCKLLYTWNKNYTCNLELHTNTH